MVVKSWFSKLHRLIKRRPQQIVINVSINGFAAGGYMNAAHLDEIRRQTARGIRDSLRSINGR